MKKLHGGKRDNAGRKSGSGKYGEATELRRLPVSWLPSIDDQLAIAALIQESPNVETIGPASTQHKQALNLTSSKVAAGFPSPAEDFIEGKLDLNDYLIRHPAASFYVRVSGESMLNAGIFPDDILLVDRAETAAHGDVVIAVLDGELTVKRLYQRGGLIRLDAENPAYPNLEISENQEMSIWGVVRACIHEFRR